MKTVPYFTLYVVTLQYHWCIIHYYGKEDVEEFGVRNKVLLKPVA